MRSLCPASILGFMVLLGGVATVAPTPSRAQIRASEPHTFTQAIDGTVFRMEYYRPRVRGRAPLFGPDAVVWEHTWTPGANWATKLAVLHADWEDVPGQDGSPDEFSNSLDMWLLPGGADGIFVPGEAYDGEFRETWAGYTMEFDPIGGESAEFQLRDDLDVIFMTGRRVN